MPTNVINVSVLLTIYGAVCPFSPRDGCVIFVLLSSAVRRAIFSVLKSREKSVSPAVRVLALLNQAAIIFDVGLHPGSDRTRANIKPVNQLAKNF